MPTTHWTFLFGCLALAGIFPFAGFWSKDAILAAVWQQAVDAPAHGLYYVLYLAGVATAVLTALYAFRAFFLTFYGPERIPARGRPPRPRVAALDDRADGDPGRRALVRGGLFPVDGRFQRPAELSGPDALAGLSGRPRHPAGGGRRFRLERRAGQHAGGPGRRRPGGGALSRLAQAASRCSPA